MSGDLKKAIETLEEKLKGVLQQAADIKKAINQLAMLNGETPPYSDIVPESSNGRIKIMPDQFFGKGLATAAGEYLKMKGRATPAKEIYEALKQGGFEFEGDEKYHLRGLAISLAKNTAKFVYIKSSDSFGLREFYPELKEKRERKQKEAGEEENNLTPENEKEMQTKKE